MEKTAVLFDYDGVLVESEPLHWAAWGLLFKELEIECQQEELECMAGRTAPEILKCILAKYRPEWQPTAQELDKLALRKNDFYLEAAPTKLKTYPGVMEGLKDLRARGISCVIVSNGRRRELLATTTMLGIQSLFDLIVSREDASAFKPDPEAYLFALRRLDIPASACVAVEDSPPGLSAALLAGIDAAAVTTNFSAEILKAPIKNRPELSPKWIGPDMERFFEWMKRPSASCDHAP